MLIPIPEPVQTNQTQVYIKDSIENENYNVAKTEEVIFSWWCIKLKSAYTGEEEVSFEGFDCTVRQVMTGVVNVSSGETIVY